MLGNGVKSDIVTIFALKMTIKDESKVIRISNNLL